MLVTMEPNLLGTGPPPPPSSSHQTASIMDSPTLARVERARIRLETNSLERSMLVESKQSSNLVGRIPIESISSGPIKRGLLWQQRDRLFSRWKERYFVLTRDYLHCFKRASGSGNDRISDMGQFIFKIKLVDVEKVEWLNRRSYSAIGLFLGREGRVLLRAEQGLEDWFELLEECTLISKERRHALRITQGPRSRASLAALPCHSALQSTNISLGSTYSSAVEDWLLTRHKTANSANNHFQLCDSVPDLSFNENNCILNRSLASKKLPSNGSAFHSSNAIDNNNSLMAHNHSYANTNSHSNFISNGYGTPLRMQNGNRSNGNSGTFNKKNVAEYDNEEYEVQLRRNAMNRNTGYENGNDKNDWMYRRPAAPNDTRHSLLTDIDISACNGLDTPASTTQRPSSYREPYYMNRAVKDSVISLRGTPISLKGAFNNDNGNGLRYSVQENLQQKETNRFFANSSNKINSNEFCDPNQNTYYKVNGNIVTTPAKVNCVVDGDVTNGSIMRNSSNNQQQTHHHDHFVRNHPNGVTNGSRNGINNNNNDNVNMIGLSAIRERYQHPALVTIINEAQGNKFRDRSYSDIQQKPRLPQDNNNSPSPRRRPAVATPTHHAQIRENQID